MKTPDYKYEPKVILNVPRSRNSEPTIVNMPIPKEQRSAIRKTRIAVGAAMGALAIGSGVILAGGLTGRSGEKTGAPTAAPVHTGHAEPAILVATAAPSVTATAEIADPDLEDPIKEPEEKPFPTATATAAPTSAPTTAPAAAPTATAKAWTAPKPQPLPKSHIMREVPF